VIALDLRRNSELGDAGLVALGAAISRGALAAAQTLDLGRCYALTSLPAEVGSLPSLRTLYLYGCSALASLPAEFAYLTSLRVLNLNLCAALTSLPSELSQLTSLRTLSLRGCNALTSMPDLSGLPQLQVKDVPAHLQAWEAGGRKAGTFADMSVVPLCVTAPPANPPPIRHQLTSSAYHAWS
jgi:hypothetical protein